MERDGEFCLPAAFLKFSRKSRGCARGDDQRDPTIIAVVDDIAVYLGVVLKQVDGKRSPRLA